MTQHSQINLKKKTKTKGQSKSTGRKGKNRRKKITKD